MMRSEGLNRGADQVSRMAAVPLTIHERSIGVPRRTRRVQAKYETYQVVLRDGSTRSGSRPAATSPSGVRKADQSGHFQSRDSGRVESATARARRPTTRSAPPVSPSRAATTSQIHLARSASADEMYPVIGSVMSVVTRRLTRPAEATVVTTRAGRSSPNWTNRSCHGEAPKVRRVTSRRFRAGAVTRPAARQRPPAGRTARRRKRTNTYGAGVRPILSPNTRTGSSHQCRLGPPNAWYGTIWPAGTDPGRGLT